MSFLITFATRGEAGPYFGALQLELQKPRHGVCKPAQTRACAGFEQGPS